MPNEEFTFGGITNPEELLEKLKVLLNSKDYKLAGGVLEAEGDTVRIAFSWRPRQKGTLAWT